MDIEPTQALVQLPQSENPQALMRHATNVAEICREIVNATARQIGKKKYVEVEGWQSIATTYGCVLSARDVERVEGGFRAIGEVRRLDNNEIISTAEGFVGDDEPDWASRKEYARRAMAQTRAMSRAARTAFAFVVVLMRAGLSTTPAEEVSPDGFENRPMKRANATSVNAGAPPPPSSRTPTAAAGSHGEWRTVRVHFGKHKSTALGEMNENLLNWYIQHWEPKEWNGRISDEDKTLRAALDAAAAEMERSAS
jgi:hypothetical protein